MSVFGDTRQEIAEKLMAGGLTAVTIDPATLPPCVLVDRIDLTESQGVGGWRGELLIRCIAPPPGDADALEAIDAAAEVVLVTLGFARTAHGLIAHTGKDCPCVTLTYPVDITHPNC